MTTEELIAAQTPMADHISRFWSTLADEYVHIVVNIRRDHEGGDVHWDSVSFPDDVAKALAADRLSSLTAPVEGMETTEEQRNGWRSGWNTPDSRDAHSLLRDVDRLSSALATKDYLLRLCEEQHHRDEAELTAERERNERLAGALREARGWIPPYKETVEVRNRIDAALSQEKQT